MKVYERLNLTRELVKSDKYEVNRIITRTKTSIRYAKENDREKTERRRERERKLEERERERGERDKEVKGAQSKPNPFA